MRFRSEAIAAYVRRAECPASTEAEPDIPPARARSYPSAAPGPRRRLPEAMADFDELFPLTMPAARRVLAKLERRIQLFEFPKIAN